MKLIDKKVFKCFRSRPTQFEIEYIPYYPEAQKIEFIKKEREGLRRLHRLEERSIELLFNV